MVELIGPVLSSNAGWDFVPARQTFVLQEVMLCDSVRFQKTKSAVCVLQFYFPLEIQEYKALPLIKLTTSTINGMSVKFPTNKCEILSVVQAKNLSMM